MKIKKGILILFLLLIPIMISGCRKKDDNVIHMAEVAHKNFIKR